VGLLAWGLTVSGLERSHAMADPQAARLNQLRNIQSKTGRTIAQLHQALAASGLQKTGERRSWLMEKFQLGYGDANTVALFVDKPLPVLDGAAAAPAPAAAAAVPDAVAALYAGPKAHLRLLHDAVMKLVQSCGESEIAPKKTYLSLRRKKQFAMLGPATKDSIELGLNIKATLDSPRLKALPAGGMCNYTVRLSKLAEIDTEIKGWIAAAFAAAG
jgi:Domain of unknown function (DUF5655)/Domain of unknown function (DUF4287)